MVLWDGPFDHRFLLVKILRYHSKIRFFIKLEVSLKRWKFWKILKFQRALIFLHCVKSAQIRSFFWSVFSRIRTEYGEILRISPYSVRMWENTDQKKLGIWTLFMQCYFNRYLDSANIYLFKFNNWNVWIISEICSKLTTKTLEWRQIT